MQVVADAEAAFEFVQARVPITRTPYQQGLVQLRHGKPVAAVTYDEFNGSNVFCHCAGDGKRWLNRWFLHEMFKHAFVTMGAQRVTLWVEDTNEASKKFVEHLGFKKEAVLQQAGASGQDVFLYVMFRADCRYA